MRDAVLDLLHREPFEPFRLVLKNGEEYTVSRPHQLAVGQTQFILHLPVTNRWARRRFLEVATVEAGKAT